MNPMAMKIIIKRLLAIVLVLIAGTALAETFVELTASGGGRYECRVDGVVVSTHTLEHKASQQAQNLKLSNPDLPVVCEQNKSIVATLTAAGRALIQGADAAVVVVEPDPSSVFFSDGFEGDPSDWECADGALTNWVSGGCGIDATFGSEFKMGAGRNSTNAVYAWKSDDVPNGFRTEANRWLTGDDLHQEVYHRWYMKWDPAADKTTPEGFKLWRYITRENGYSNPPVIYLNARGLPTASDLVSAGDLIIIASPSNLSLISMSEVMDNEWHAYELRIKLNDFGSSNGEIQFWFDGVDQGTFTGLDFGQAPDMKIHRFGVGIGNVSDTPWQNSEWAAIAFDDVALSTSYVGP